jgi:hypothetical protein
VRVTADGLVLIANPLLSKVARRPSPSGSTTLLADAVDEARIAADIAEELFQARSEAGLTQKELA